jgi:hypothetical protein
MSIDADGSPRCYALPGSGLVGLDSSRNARDKHGRWDPDIVVCNELGVPLTQTQSDPCPGFLISQTALSDKSKRAEDPTRYVNAEVVPYISIPPDLHGWGVHVGDVAMVSFLDKRSSAVVADVGPSGKYGEGSIALANALGIPSSPRSGGITGNVCYVVFPGSRKRWPRANDDVASQAEALFAAWGPERLIRLFGVPVA